MGCMLSKCFLESFSSIPASFGTADITFNASSSFISSFLGFQRPLTIMHDFQEYESASSSWCERRVFTFCTTASSPSITEIAPSKRPTLFISSSIIFCRFLIISLDLLVWWFSCCWEVGARCAGVVPLILVVQAFLGMFFYFFFFVSFSSFIHNKNFKTSYVTICEISSNMILSFVFATNHLLKTWPQATIMERRLQQT